MKQNQIDICVIATSVPFPVGIAATNRIISYLKPICERGYKAKVVITRPTEKEPQILNPNCSGNIYGIDYEYLNNTTIWPIKGNYFKKFMLIFIANMGLVRLLINEKPKVVITYSSILFIKYILLLLRVFLGFKLIIEETEYPKILKWSSLKFMHHLHLMLYKYADGMLIMTAVLVNYYNSLSIKKSFHLPMTVDPSRFDLFNFPNSKRQKYFIYAGGSGGFKRDGVFDIVKAFGIFTKIDTSFTLKIVGQIDHKSTLSKEIITFIQHNDLISKVDFTGNLPSSEIPNLLMNATGIVMAPPIDFESGGFPTKLGEFLASGTPTICTDVASVKYYLTSENAYLAKTGDVHDICDKMVEIITDPIKANEIGFEGRKLATKVFNAETYVEDLIVFFGLNVMPQN